MTDPPTFLAHHEMRAHDDHTGQDEPIHMREPTRQRDATSPTLHTPVPTACPLEPGIGNLAENPFKNPIKTYRFFIIRTYKNHVIRF